MQEISGVLLRAVRDMLSWNVLRFALFVGLPLGALWIWIGYNVWDYVVLLTSMVIGWIPFSVVKANGALLIVFFVWLVAVLVSFAAVTALVGPPLLRRFKERTYYVYTFTTLLLLSGAWAAAIMARWEEVFAQIERLLTLLPFKTVADASAGLLGFYLLYNLYILSLFFVISLFRKRFLEHIRQIEYPQIEPPQKGAGRFVSVRMVKDALYFLLFSIILFPVLFIPLANLAVQLVLWAWLYKESYFMSTCNLYCDRDEFEEAAGHRVVISVIALMTAVLNYLPVINVFAPFFAQLMFFHWIMGKKAQSRLEVKAQTESKEA